MLWDWAWGEEEDWGCWWHRQLQRVESENAMEWEKHQYSWRRAIIAANQRWGHTHWLGWGHMGAPPSQSVHISVAKPWNEILWSDPLTSGCGCGLALGLWTQLAMSTKCVFLCPGPCAQCWGLWSCETWCLLQRGLESIRQTLQNHPRKQFSQHTTSIHVASLARVKQWGQSGGTMVWL
jgi:hypothetical protein